MSISYLHSLYPKAAQNRGTILVSVIVFAAIAVTMTIGLVNWGAALLDQVRVTQQREQALQVAEAGIDYYRWHLAHAQNDFKDGTNTAGPYVHHFTDKDGTTIGSYALNITAPSVGSTLVTIVSKGTLTANANISRTIKVTMAIPSLAKYATVANDNMYFGSGTEIFGPIHSNKGVHLDGVAHNAVTSAVSTYVDPDYGSTRYGVYTLVSPADPNPPGMLTAHADVFRAGRQFPVPAVDFSGLTTNLSQLKSLAQSGGRYFAASGSQGYHIVLKTNDTFDLYKVTVLQSAPNNCSNSLNQNQWGTWSIKTQTFLANYAFPGNGVIFLEDHVWVDGQIDGARVTIAAGKLPDPGVTQEPNITVNTNLLYTNMDGSDVIGLIAQGNVNVGLWSDDTFTIDGALIAQNGRVGRFYYSGNCRSGSTNYYNRSTLNLYGMIGTNQRYGFAYTDGTGYDTRNITYDSNLLYGPPPSFPLTSNQYQTLSWQEI